jgi:putative salt-induced outer membrane protein
MRFVFVCFLTICSAALSFAGQLTLKNGDRLTGDILKSDAKTVTIKTAYAGEVSVAWDAIVSIDSDSPLHIGLKDGQMLVGLVKTADGNVQVHSKDAGPVTAPRDAIQSIRSPEQQAVYDAEIDRYRNPRLVDLWAGFVDLGYSVTRGNADTSNIAVSANATRATSRDKIGVNFTSLYASNNTTGRSLVTANAIRGGINYNLNLTPRAFTFASADLEFDEFQRLDLRFAPAGGFGYSVLKTDRAIFSLQGGASLNREFFSTGLNRTSGEALFGEELGLKLNHVTTLHEKLLFFANVSNTGSYRINFDTSMETKIKRWLAWQATVSSRFLSNPVAGRQRNDLLFTTGFRLSFAK